MPTIHKRFHAPLHALEESINDKRIYTPRISGRTRRAIKSADRIATQAIPMYGRSCNRVLLVFIDNHVSPDSLVCVVFALSDGMSLVAYVSDSGSLIDLTLHNVRTSKRLPRNFMYMLAGVDYNQGCKLSDAKHDSYNTRVYARNRNCYK